jgi:hypothetical protein
MCVIAIQPRGVQISREYLQNCWDTNSHGAGLMYAHNGKIIVKKEMDSFDKFMTYVQQASKHDSAVVIHFRIATSGGINDYNCHPFKVHKNLYFCHNGILDITVPHGSKENDTQIFNNGLMKPLPYNFYKNNAIMNLLEFTIGSYNKFVFLDDAGDYYILNEKAGEWSEEGAWFSNTSYKRPKYTAPSHYGYNKGYYGTGYYQGKPSYDWDDDDYAYAKPSTTTKDAFEEEDKEITAKEIADLSTEYDFCDSCSNWVDLGDTRLISDYNTVMCSGCREDFQVGEFNPDRKVTDDIDKPATQYKMFANAEDHLYYD